MGFGQPILLAANGTAVLPQTIGVRSFLAVTAGTLTVVNEKGDTVLNAFPVAAGTQYDLNLVVKSDTYAGPLQSATVVLAGGASGTVTY